MSPDAAAIWDEFAPALIEMGVLTTVDVDAFADWCKLRVLLRNQGGMMDPKVYTQLVESSARQGALFGLNPSARPRLKTSKPDAKPADDGMGKFFHPKLAKA